MPLQMEQVGWLQHGKSSSSVCRSQMLTLALCRDNNSVLADNFQLQVCEYNRKGLKVILTSPVYTVNTTPSDSSVFFNLNSNWRVKLKPQHSVFYEKTNKQNSVWL